MNPNDKYNWYNGQSYQHLPYACKYYCDVSELDYVTQRNSIQPTRIQFDYVTIWGAWRRALLSDAIHTIEE